MLATGNLGNLAGFWNSDERDAVAVALDAVVPGASELGAVDYVEGLLTAFDHDPPHIWAAPGGGWLEVGPWEQQAWRERIASWRQVYERVVRGEHAPGDSRVLHTHACEAAYGDPVYGGNRDQAGWQRIGFPTPLFRP
jgi:hypothetical protein